MSQIGAPSRFRVVDASGKVMDSIAVVDTAFDFDLFFESHHGRIAVWFGIPRTPKSWLSTSLEVLRDPSRRR